jgi:FkbM family methyltransferase
MVWRKIWDFTLRYNGTLVRTKIHGFDAIVPIGHWYLLVIQNYPKFNSPLLLLCQLVYKIKGRGLVIVDVGSAVGDTVLYIESKLPEINRYVCIDGDDEYNEIIQSNLRFLNGRFHLINSLVSDKEEKIGKIEKVDPTTGSALSKNLGNANSLDNLLIKHEEIDLLKIDIDGFDGVALAGSKGIIEKFKPAIIFEWNIPLFIKTKNDIMTPFKVLIESGYRYFYWFDNFGNFLFSQVDPSLEELNQMAHYSVRMENINGYHYDVIALTKQTDFIDLIS